MKKKSKIVAEAISLGALCSAFGILVIMLGAYIGAVFEESCSYGETSFEQEIFPVIMCVIGVLLIIMGVVGVINYIKEWYGPNIEAEGKVIEIIRRYNSGTARVIVEFDNGMRYELIVGKKFFLSAGDVGLIGAQGKHLVYFKKQFGKEC